MGLRTNLLVFTANSGFQNQFSNNFQQMPVTGESMTASASIISNPGIYLVQLEIKTAYSYV